MNPGLLSAFFTDAPCAFALIGPNLELLEHNALFAQFLQKQSQAGEAASQRLPPGLLRNTCEMAIQEGKVAKSLFLGNTEDRTSTGAYWAEVFPVSQGKKCVAGVILREEPSRGEQYLKRLGDQTRRNQELLKDMDAFCYSISHDLKAPLRAVMGFSQAVQLEANSALPGRAAEYLERVRGGAERMSEMMDRLLQYSRAARQEPVRSKVDVSALAAALAGQAQTPGSARVDWQIQPGMVAQTDERYLKAVLEILLGNALKFTQGRAEPRIEVGVSLVGEEKCFFVRDNGVGYDPAYAEKLFSPFQRLHAPEDFPGEGMGLAIARRILRRLGGRIYAESQPEQGATFFFTVGD